MGHWSDEKVVGRIAAWMRTAVGIMESSHVRVARFADNMRNVAVTEGDKVEAQMKFGWEVDAYPVNELAEYVKGWCPKGEISQPWWTVLQQVHHPDGRQGSGGI